MLVLLVAVPARALEFDTVTNARDDAGRLHVLTQLHDPIETRVENSLLRGMPATLLLHVELWRRREGWFDRMETSSDAGLRLRYDVWKQEWRIERPGAPVLILPSLDSLRTELSRPLSFALPGLDRLPPDGPCYVVVTATVKPLSVEDVEEVEGWISGEVKDQGGAGFGVITRLPRSVFDAVRNFTGFGDSHARIRSPEFTPAGLPPTRR
jgi:hypothetical protein